MKKIALLHYAYPPNIGGVETLISEQADILSKSGYDILVLTGSGKTENPKIKLIEAPILQSILRTNPDLQQKIVEKGIIDEDFHKLTAEIEKLLETHLSDRDVIIVHNMLTLVHNLPFIQAFKNFVAKNPQKKIIVWAHDQTFINEEKILTDKEGVNLNQEQKELLLNPVKEAKYIVISETFKQLFIRIMNLTSDQVSVITDGINMKEFLEIEDSIWDIVQEKNLLQRFPVILSPVNILPRKNIESCLDIIWALKKHYPDICYIISGKPSQHRKTGEYLEMLKKKIAQINLADNIIFLSDYFDRSLKTQEIHDLYDLSDAILYLSKSENFGLPILEASLSKTPIFLSDLSVFHEIGADNLIYISPERKTEDVAEQIRRYFEDNMIVKMNRLVRAKYNLESIIKEKLIPKLT